MDDDQAKQAVQAVLPDDLSSERHSIGIMEIGSTAWTHPWAMYHDAERKLWLDGSHAIRAEPFGSAQMKVRRDEAGWHVDAGACREHKWGLGSRLALSGFHAIAVVTFTCE